MFFGSSLSIYNATSSYSRIVVSMTSALNRSMAVNTAIYSALPGVVF